MAVFIWTYYFSNLIWNRCRNWELLQTSINIAYEAQHPRMVSFKCLLSHGPIYKCLRSNKKERKKKKKNTLKNHMTWSHQHFWHPDSVLASVTACSEVVWIHSGLRVTAAGQFVKRWQWGRNPTSGQACREMLPPEHQWTRFYCYSYLSWMLATHSLVRPFKRLHIIITHFCFLNTKEV